jgi:hypothetical protein
LLPNRDGGPEADEAGGEIHAGHESMDVVQSRRRVGLTEIELEPATEHGDRRNQEQANLNDHLARQERCFGGHGWHRAAVYAEICRLFAAFRAAIASVAAKTGYNRRRICGE